MGVFNCVPHLAPKADSLLGRGPFPSNSELAEHELCLVLQGDRAHSQVFSRGRPFSFKLPRPQPGVISVGAGGC